MNYALFLHKYTPTKMKSRYLAWELSQNIEGPTSSCTIRTMNNLR